MPKHQGDALTHDIHRNGMDMEMELELQLPLLSAKEQAKCKYIPNNMPHYGGH
ncbi:hypothetical protein KR093_011455 [Drosophila rubida]|uniref:Uncharacterized protein n=1 Tax=Drosophila rubida TaxID=30044 RepID=A0AAD4JV70_9MUSC|nr:hypothetical protein KR093_011455 [Drosophila rubida]